MQPAQLLQLAESMAAKQLAAAPVGGAAAAASRREAVLLHAAILQAQGKPAAAAEMLRGPAGDAFVMPAERRIAIASLLVKP